MVYLEIISWRFGYRPKYQPKTPLSGLENSTRPLVFMSASGCRASENFDISSENQFFPIYGNNIYDAGQVPTLRYFETCFIIPRALPHVIICLSHVPSHYFNAFYVQNVS